MTPTDPTSRRDRDRLAADAIRALTLDAVEASGDGHPGMPMGAAPMGWALYRHAMRHDPAVPDWWNRDRYVQSAGHGSMLQYALLHLSGYDVGMDDLRGYRQFGSRTPGHPEVGHTPGVETTTGPLGQGLATAVGMAFAEAHLAARFNRDDLTIVDHRTWVIAGDGDLMEGVTSEASSLAGTWKLGKLTVLYDDNRITIDGTTDATFTEDVLARYAAYGWQVLRVEAGDDADAILEALEAARADTERPTLIAVRTVIGYGSPNRAGTSKVHGARLGEEETAATKAALGIDWPAFTVPDALREETAAIRTAGADAYAAWTQTWQRYQAAYPEDAAAFTRRMYGERPDGWDADLPTWAPGSDLATRKASQAALGALADALPELVGGSADLAGSNLTDLEGETPFGADTPGGRIVRFGVREHAMAAIANGAALHGGLRPFVATFLVFSDYLRPALRLSALMKQPVTYVFTHDSIGLGGDGPTHQPEAHLASLRAIPNLRVLRPADANETAQAWREAIARTDGPTALILTRQGVPTLEVPAGAVARGGYVQRDLGDGAPRVALLASGSEVGLCLAAQERLADAGLPSRVVSLPDVETFLAHDADHVREVLGGDVPRLAVEAAVPLGWHRLVGDGGDVLGVEDYGASAPGGEVLAAFGFTPEHVAERARALLNA